MSWFLSFLSALSFTMLYHTPTTHVPHHRVIIQTTAFTTYFSMHASLLLKPNHPWKCCFLCLKCFRILLVSQHCYLLAFSILSFCSLLSALWHGHHGTDNSLYFININLFINTFISSFLLYFLFHIDTFAIPLFIQSLYTIYCALDTGLGTSAQTTWLCSISHLSNVLIHLHAVKTI